MSNFRTAHVTTKSPDAGQRSAAGASKSPGRPAADHTELSRFVGNSDLAMLQENLAIGRPGDRHEQEADRMADRVSDESGNAREQLVDGETEARYGDLDNQDPRRRSAAANAEDNEDKQGQFGYRVQRIHRSSTESSGTQLNHNATGRIRAAADDGRLMQPKLRHFMERNFGASFDDVRVHTNGDANTLSQSLNAKAFTVGPHVFFGRGHYSPTTRDGIHLLAHELTHVLQQGKSRPYIQRQEGTEVTAESTETTEERPPTGPIIGTIHAPPFVWFTYLDGRYLVRVQSDWYAADVLGYSREAAHRLYVENRRPDVANPTLPVEQFIDALESQSGLRLLAAARADLTARGNIPLDPFGDEFLAVYLTEIDLIRWFGSEQWSAYLRRPVGMREGGADLMVGGEARAGTHAIESDRTVFVDNEDLSLMFLILMEHFTGLELTSEVEALVDDGLDAAELASVIGDHPLRGVLTDLYSQGWREFTGAGGSDVARFEPLIERVLEQYQRGNLNATANRLKIGRGVPERSMLGIVHRSSGLLLYDHNGMPLQGLAGMALRDAGFIGFEPPDIEDETAASLREVARLLNVDEADLLTTNLFGQALGGADIVMVGQAAQAAFNNVEAVADRVWNGLSDEVKRTVGEVLLVVITFMLGHALARLLMRSPYTLPVGVALELLLRAAGYVLGLTFLLQTWEILLQAAFHLSRIRNDEHGNPTRLSEVHMELAARPVQRLIANVVAAMTAIGFGATIRRIRAGRSRGRWERPDEPIREILEGEEASRAPPERAEVATAEGVPEAGTARPVEPRTVDPALETTAETPRAPESTTVEAESAAAPEAPAPAPSLEPSTSVSVNTRSGVFHPPGTRWHGSTGSNWRSMTLAEAEAAGFRRTGSGPGPPPETGVYEVVRPTRGDPRVVIRSWLGYRQARAGLERAMRSAGEYAIELIRGWQRAHSTGAGLGIESGEAIRLAPEMVNQALQNRGIEAFLRALRDDYLPAGRDVHLTTVTRTHSGTLRLASIHYIVEAPEAGGRMITLFEAVVEVRLDGMARPGVRSPGADTYTYGPWSGDTAAPVAPAAPTAD